MSAQTSESISEAILKKIAVVTAVSVASAIITKALLPSIGAMLGVHPFGDNSSS